MDASFIRQKHAIQQPYTKILMIVVSCSTMFFEIRVLSSRLTVVRSQTNRNAFHVHHIRITETAPNIPLAVQVPQTTSRDVDMKTPHSIVKDFQVYNSRSTSMLMTVRDGNYTPHQAKVGPRLMTRDLRSSRAFLRRPQGRGKD